MSEKDNKQVIEVNVKTNEILEAERKRAEEERKRAEDARLKAEEIQKAKEQLEKQMIELQRQAEEAKKLREETEKQRVAREDEAKRLAEERKQIEEEKIRYEKEIQEYKKKEEEAEQRRKEEEQKAFEAERQAFIDKAKSSVNPEKLEAIEKSVSNPEDLKRAKFFYEEFFEDSRKKWEEQSGLRKEEEERKKNAARGNAPLNPTAGGNSQNKGKIGFDNYYQMTEYLRDREEVGDTEAGNSLNKMFETMIINAKKKIDNMDLQPTGDDIQSGGVTSFKDDESLLEFVNKKARMVAKAERDGI